MNKNSNAYIIIYTVVMVVIVATLLTFAATSLKERQEIGRASCRERV